MRTRLDSDTGSVEESRNVVRRLVCPGTVVEVDTDDEEQPLVQFCPPTEVVECLERDLLDVRDSHMDLSSGGCDVRGAVGACVVGVPSRSIVDCTRVAEIVERRCEGVKRLRLRFAGSQATTVPGSLLDVPFHVDPSTTQDVLSAGGDARADDSAIHVADESYLVEMADDPSTDHVDDDAESFAKDLSWVPK